MPLCFVNNYQIRNASFVYSSITDSSSEAKEKLSPIRRMLSPIRHSTNSTGTSSFFAGIITPSRRSTTGNLYSSSQSRNSKERIHLLYQETNQTMDFDASCSLVLCGKSSVETDAATRLKNNNVLKLPDNTKVSIFLQSEIKNLVKDDDSFNLSLFMNSISTHRFGRFLIWSPFLSSTHDVVSHNFSEIPVGSVCVTDIQFKGRGRTKNVWESPKGCLMYSFTVEMEDGRVVPLIQYVVSLAVTEAVKDVCDKKGLSYIDVKIKWPNDLYLNGLKVGGILCTSTYGSRKFHVSVGVGLNVDNEQPTTCLNAVLKDNCPASNLLKREEILGAFFHKFETFFDLFMEQGFKSLEELYYRTWLHSGQRVIVEEKNEDQVVQNVVTIQGLTSLGYLLAIGDDNVMYELHPDGNSFDFFKGLVRRKL